MRINDAGIKPTTGPKYLFSPRGERRGVTCASLYRRSSLLETSSFHRLALTGRHRQRHRCRQPRLDYDSSHLHRLCLCSCVAGVPVLRHGTVSVLAFLLMMFLRLVVWAVTAWKIARSAPLQRGNARCEPWHSAVNQ